LENDDSEGKNIEGSKSEDIKGAFERQRQFSEERFSLLSSKEERSERVARQFTLSSQSVPEDPSSEPLPKNFRLKLVETYRERQIQKQNEHSTESSDNNNDKFLDNRKNKKQFEIFEDTSQPIPPVAPPANNWIPIGPFVLRKGQGGVKPSTSGRAVGIAVASDGKRVYVASANGGVWRSDDTGLNWYSLMEAFDLDPTTLSSDSLACGALAIDLSNPDRIYVGTGEGDSGDYFGVGPIVSYDGGQNWNTEQTSPESPQLAGSAFYALALDPSDPNKVIAATKEGLYRRESNGVGGFHWVKKKVGSDKLFSSIVAAHNEGLTTFYAAKYSGPIYISNDGQTWSAIGTGFPLNVRRISLAIQPNNPSVVYALTESNEVWRLDIVTGSSNKWRKINGSPKDLLGNQGWYDIAIAVDPNDVNILYLGGSTKESQGEWSGSLYRSVVKAKGAGDNVIYEMNNTYIGNSVHADIHTLVFAPGDSNKLWLGCDGGVFYSTHPRDNGDIFESRNAGLSTLTMNHMDQHPTEDAVIFCGTQDNGGERFTGEESWLYSSDGDCGYYVINWNDPYKILSTYTYGLLNRSTNGGQRNSYEEIIVPLTPEEGVLFYAPLIGTPYTPSDPARAEIVAFGSIRPWISTDFGNNWISIPANSLSNDRLDDVIRSLCLFSHNKLYAGTMSGGIYRFDKTGNEWQRTRLDKTSLNGVLPLNGVITDIAIDLLDATGNSIYISLGGSGDYRHVWHFDGNKWDPRSGPSVNSSESLLDVQVNSIVVDPKNPSHVFIGADIGCWRSIDSGIRWKPFSEGLPDVAVIDLKIHTKRLIRTSTYGRGLYERTLDDVQKQGVELFIRHTQLDRGRFATAENIADPTDPKKVVKNGNSPDIKLDTPDPNGHYQFPLSKKEINYLEFEDTLIDDSTIVATHPTTNILSRVYVQVHSHGVVLADNVQVMLLISNIASEEAPVLPPAFDNNVREKLAINNSNWKTLGIVKLDNLRVGYPKIVTFELNSNIFSSEITLNRNNSYYLLALVHHTDDPFRNTELNTDSLSKNERKAALKKIRVIPFEGTFPSE